MKANERLAIKILQSDEFKDNPPVLLDIGASDEIHNKEWKVMAPYSILVAFDADEREIDYLEVEGSPFLKKVVVKRVVSDKSLKKQTFYLTHSPVCSSSLKPDNASLERWHFHERFVVEKSIQLPTVHMPEILKRLGLKQVDWFKTDSQGTDWRLFLSLGKAITRVLAADFEPGIIDAYEGEDKLWQIIKDMEKMPYWMSDCIVRGPRRISKEVQKKYFKDGLLITQIIPSPGWAEIGYLHNFESKLDRRSVLLLAAISLLKHQYGFALEVCDKAGLEILASEVVELIKARSVLSRLTLGRL
jgi:hypothetical protein